MTASYAVRCRCGAQAFALPGPPPRVTICFCRDCQRRAGGPFGLATYYPEEGLDLPVLPTWRRRADSGRWLETSACPSCGVVLYQRFERRPGVVGIPLGLVDGARDTPPDRAVFCVNKPAWVQLPDGIEAYVAGSDGPRWTG
ncbi:MAG: GFA family protein [Alphaproteobacteria bacterium]|nr:GFA family protein [Alphaproteobacteria bacterium]